MATRDEASDTGRLGGPVRPLRWLNGPMDMGEDFSASMLDEEIEAKGWIKSNRPVGATPPPPANVSGGRGAADQGRIVNDDPADIDP